MEKNYQLTDEQANLVKDILKLIGTDEKLGVQFAKACGQSHSRFDSLADDIYIKLGNGRVQVVEQA